MIKIPDSPYHFGNQVEGERVCGPTQHSVDEVNVEEVKIELDWQIRLRADSPIAFQVRLSRRDKSSVIDFAIELAKLAGADLGRLHDLLADRPRGYQLACEVAWLLGVSVAQQRPALSEEARSIEVRKLLLAHPHAIRS